MGAARGDARPAPEDSEGVGLLGVHLRGHRPAAGGFRHAHPERADLPVVPDFHTEGLQLLQDVCHGNARAAAARPRLRDLTVWPRTASPARSRAPVPMRAMLRRRCMRSRLVSSAPPPPPPPPPPPHVF